MTWDAWYTCLWALTAWREARGEDSEGMRAVLHVILNRLNLRRWGDADHLIESKWQFSSMTAPGDPMLVQWPDSPDPVFAKALELANLIYTGKDVDPTGGATHYFNPRVVLPTWAASMKKTATIGHHIFYK